MTTTKHENLAAALAAAQAAAAAVEKDARNAHMRYDYASAEAIIGEARAALASAGVAVIPLSAVVSTIADGLPGWTPNAMLRAVWRVSYGGEHIDLDTEWPILIEKGRPADKALAGARTASLGYFLRDLLLLPRVEKGAEMDDDARTPEAPSARAERIELVETAMTTPHGFHLIHGHMGAMDRSVTADPELKAAWTEWQGTLRRHPKEIAPAEQLAMRNYVKRAKALLDGVKWEATEDEAAAVELLRNSRTRSAMESDATEGESE